jgi:hypothetical protein
MKTTIENRTFAATRTRTSPLSPAKRNRPRTSEWGGLGHPRRLNVGRIFLLTLGVTLPLSLPAQTNFAINWFKIAGGGGTSTGSVYSVSGTLGQPDAGKLTRGAYTLNGGFWSIVAAIQTPGAPLLSITRTATNTVAVSWPSPYPGYALEQNPDVATTNWVEVAQAPADDGTNKTVIVHPPVGKMFYRLRKP